MNFTGRRFVMVLMMVMVASVAAFTQDVKKLVLMDELHRVFPDEDEFNRNVWDLSPRNLTSIDVYENKEPISLKFNIDYIARVDKLRVRGYTKFDSDVYRQIFPNAETVPQIEGTFLNLVSKYDPEQNFVAFIFDNAVYNNIITEFEKINEDGDKYHSIVFKKENQTQSNGKIESVDVTAISDKTLDMSSMFYAYTDKNGQIGNFVPSLKPLVIVLSITHPYGNFQETYGKDTIDLFELDVLNVNHPKLAPVAQSFKDAYLMPVQYTVQFMNGERKGFVIFRQDNGYYLFVSTTFLKTLMY